MSHRGTVKRWLAFPLALVLHHLCFWGQRKVFYDEVSIRMQEGTTDALRRAVHGTLVGVFVLTRDFFESEWCMGELRAFVKRGPQHWWALACGVDRQRD